MAFHALRVADVRRETDEATSVAFEVPDELRPVFAFAPGQYLTLRAFLDGEEVRRSYSVCTAPADDELRVMVKRVPQGRFSQWVSEQLAPGDEVDVMPPLGRFTPAPDPKPGRHVLAVAAGSGITPVLSVIRHVLLTEPDARVTLVYGNRRTTTIAFREHLADLKDRFLERFRVIHVLSQEPGVSPLHSGRVDADKVRLLCKTLVDPADVDEAFLCGPQQMSVAVRAALLEVGVDAHRIHVELFGTPESPPAPPVRLDAPGATASVVLHGREATVDVKPGETLLDAGRRAGLDLPWSCSAGVCATCRAKVEGEVDMAVNHSLEPWELDAGYRLTCQSRPLADRVRVDFDA